MKYTGPEYPGYIFNVALTVALSAAPVARAADSTQPDGWGVNIYGASYHFEHEYARSIGVGNEFNPGLGLRKGLWRRGAHRVYGEAGMYYDSGEHWAKTADVTYQYEVLGNPRAGAGLFLFHTPTYNRGKSVLVPLPVVSYDFGRVELNMAYAPKWGELNSINTLGFYLTVKLN
jgi:hypothetical protein